MTLEHKDTQGVSTVIKVVAEKVLIYVRGGNHLASKANVISRGREQKQNGFPEGTIESLLPIFQEAEGDGYRPILAPESGTWEGLRQQAKYSTFGEAINILRRYGHGAKEVSDEVMERVLNMSGTVGDARIAARETLGWWLEGKIRRLYVSTTGFSPKKR